MPNESYISKPDDFKKRAESDRRARAERVVLPKSGLTVLLARPSTRWFLFHQRLPTSLAAHAHVGAVRPDELQSGPLPSGGETPLLQHDDARELAEWVVALVQKTVVEPRLSLNPGPGEISPDWLSEEDVDFIIRYAVGEVVALTPEASPTGKGERGEGGDLAPFRREREPSAAGPGGGNVSPVAVGAAGDGPRGFSD